MTGHKSQAVVIVEHVVIGRELGLSPSPKSPPIKGGETSVGREMKIGVGTDK